ncbi:MAG: glycosyltransferase family 2 protein, partial [Thermoleophilaceae bacterium]
MSAAAVIPNWNGRAWLPRCLASLAAQTRPFAEVVVVDNGSTDGSLDYLAAEQPDVRVIALGENTGFARAANRGIEAVQADAVALINTDVELEPDWHERMLAALEAGESVASVACKMVDLHDPGAIYDAGDFLRRDGVAEQRGRFERDDGVRFDTPCEAFSACAGAALYRRRAVLDAGGFDERYFAYLEDVELGLRLRLAGYTCR